MKKKRRLFSWILVGAVLIGLSCTFGSFWAGRTAIRLRALEDYAVPGGIPELKEDERARLPYFYCKTKPFAPFLVRVDCGWVTGPLTGHGGSAIYGWFFGWIGQVRVLEAWDV